MTISSIMLVKLIMAGFLAAIAELDRIAVLHSLFYEPIVISSLIGLALGEPLLGLEIGLVTQLVFLGSISVGGSLPPDPTLPAAAAAFAGAVNLDLARDIYGESVAEHALVALVIILCVPLASLSRLMEKRIKEANIELAHEADRLASDGKTSEPFMGKIILKSIWRFFIAYMVVGVISLAAAGLACRLILEGGGEFFGKSLSGFYMIMLLVAVGSSLTAIKVRGSRVAFVALALAVTRF